MKHKTILLSVSAAAAILLAGNRAFRSAPLSVHASAAPTTTASPNLDHAVERSLELAQEAHSSRSKVESSSLDRRDTSETLASITSLLESEDFDQIGHVLHDYLAGAEDPIAAISEVLSFPLGRPVEAVAAGLILQTGIRYAASGEALMGGVTAEDIASLALEHLDIGPYSSRALYVGMSSLGDLLPGHLIGDLVRRMRSTELVNVEVHSQLERLHLLREWSTSMGPEAELTLRTLAVDPESSLAVRSGGVLGLMNRDWRTHAPELAEVYRGLRENGMDASSGAGFLFMANLAGTNLALHGRDRLELLRELIGDEELATYALTALPENLRTQLSVYANEADREWPPYRWVELAGNGEEAIEAGHSLLADSRTDPNVARGYSLVQRLMELDASDPRLQDELEWRYMQRDTNDDLFWGLFEFNQQTLPRSVQEHELPRFLERTNGDNHPTRRRVLAKFRQAYPQLAAGLQ